jgi:fructokinase
MILVLGEILFDLFPTYNRIGGAPFNFAFHLKGLGFPVRFVSRVGNDVLGKQILDFLEQNGFNTDDIQRDPEHNTGTVTVAMDNDGNHTFSIIPDTAYDHIVFDTHLAALCCRPWDLVYFGSLIQRTPNGARLVQKVLSKKQENALRFCDINLRPGCYTQASLAESLNLADVLKLNREELEEISGINSRDKSYGEQVTRLMMAHSLDLVILTLGKQGSQWFTKKTCRKALATTNQPIIDTVGAGDAYAAMAVAGRLSRLSDAVTMDLAREFAGYICGFKGALPDGRDIYQDFTRRLKG